MGYGSAGIHHFDPIARALIDENVDDATTEKVLTDLIARLQTEDWDTEYDSLDRFTEHPAVVRAFAANGIVATAVPEPDDLTTWPRLLVVGTDVTPEQADDILIRTADPFMHRVNDASWTYAVHRAFGVTPDHHGSASTDSVRAARAELGILPLTTLYTSRISSAWVEGPRGWCDWDGRIGCASYNIGPNPDRNEVTTEWRLIAAAWPFLDLTGQLLADEGDGPALAQWRVLDGHVTEQTPATPITTPTEMDPGAVYKRMFTPGGERGVTLPRLTAAIQRVRANTTGGTS